MFLIKGILLCLLIALGTSVKDSSETCKTSDEDTKVGQGVALKFGPFPCPKPCRPMLIKNDEEFCLLYGDVHDLVYKGYQGEELKRLRQRLTASTLSEDPLGTSLTVIFSSVEAGDRGRYCLTLGRSCLQCVRLDVTNGSSSDLNTGDETGNTGMIIGMIIAAVVLCGIAYLGYRCICQRRTKRNGQDGQAQADDQGTVPLEVLEPPGPRNDVINEEQEPLQDDNAANPQPEEDGN